MGRSFDADRYETHVRRMLNHPKFNVQLEAVRASGELVLEFTRRSLMDLFEQEVLDPDIRDAAIWALSQIGGEQVEETLEGLLEKAENDDDEGIYPQRYRQLSPSPTGQQDGSLGYRPGG